MQGRGQLHLHDGIILIIGLRLAIYGGRTLHVQKCNGVVKLDQAEVRGVEGGLAESELFRFKVEPLYQIIALRTQQVSSEGGFRSVHPLLGMSV